MVPVSIRTPSPRKVIIGGKRREFSDEMEGQGLDISCPGSTYTLDSKRKPDKKFDRIVAKCLPNNEIVISIKDGEEAVVDRAILSSSTIRKISSTDHSGKVMFTICSKTDSSFVLHVDLEKCSSQEDLHQLKLIFNSFRPKKSYRRNHGYAPHSDFDKSRDILPPRKTETEMSPRTIDRSQVVSKSPNLAGAKKKLSFVAYSPENSMDPVFKSTGLTISRKKSVIRGLQNLNTPFKRPRSSRSSDDDFETEISPPPTPAPIASPPKLKSMKQKRVSYELEDRSTKQVFQVARAGIRNIGNSCYMASVLQSISNLDSFVSKCLERAIALTEVLMKKRKLDAAKVVPEGEEAINLAEEGIESQPTADRVEETLEFDTMPISMISALMARLRCEERKVLDIGMIKDVFVQKYPDFGGYQQHDAHEFFTSFIDFIDDKFNPGKIEGQCPGESIFNFKIENTLKCPQCKYERKVCEDYSNISVDFESEDAKNVREDKRRVTGMDKFTIPCTSKLIQKYMDPKIQELKCEKCSNDTVQIFPIFQTVPIVLMVHIKRFFVNLKTMSFEKLFDKVQVSTELSLKKLSSNDIPEKWPLYPSVESSEMQKFSGGDFSMFLRKLNACKDKTFSNPEAKYSLKAIVQHDGKSTNSGHYYADIRFKDSWNRFDDDKVYPVTEDAALSTAKKSGYLLFYELASV